MKKPVKIDSDVCCLAIETAYKTDKNGGRQLYTNTLFTHFAKPLAIFARTRKSLNYSPYLEYCKN